MQRNRMHNRAVLLQSQPHISDILRHVHCVVVEHPVEETVRHELMLVVPRIFIILVEPHQEALHLVEFGVVLLLEG